MKTEFTIEVIARLQDKKFLLTGRANGPLAVGAMGRVNVSKGETLIEILGIGLSDPILDNPGTTSVLALLNGPEGLARGVTIEFNPVEIGLR